MSSRSSPAKVGDIPHPLTLWYDRPASAWVEALPVANGQLAAMVFGGMAIERLQLNEGTLWSGGPRQWNRPEARRALADIRRAVFEERYADAHELGKGMMGPFTEAYLPMADLYLRFDGEAEFTDYRRSMDLCTAIAAVRYRRGEAMYTREVFASHPAGVIVVRLTTTAADGLSFAADLSSPLRFRTAAVGQELILDGKAPSHVTPSYLKEPDPLDYAGPEGMTFQCRLHVQAQGGTVRAEKGSAAGGSRLIVNGARAVTLLLAAATSFNGSERSPVREGRDPAAACAAHLAAAASRSYDQLRREHEADYRRLFDRVTVDLGHAPRHTAALPTDQRIVQGGASDPGLVALLFQFGRYLMIAASRPNSQPMNLQGLWNDQPCPPWSSNYTLNINTQMNYWPAEVANLSECHKPLLDLAIDLARTGSQTARVNYGCRGWVAHHNSDLWRQSAAPGDWGIGDSTWALWPMAAPWLCRHLWEHYQFTCDREFLRSRAWPIMKAAAEFCLDFLVDDGHGHLVTVPSTSPENQFISRDGRRCAVAMASTMDMALIHDLFGNCIAASAELGCDEAFASQLSAARERLLNPSVAPDGRLREWFRDFAESEPHHRHVSHLWGLYPGCQITRDTPELSMAARRSLEARGDEGSGWSLAWKINLWARLGEGDRCHALLSRLLTLIDNRQEANYTGGGVYANLFDAHPPFQIDGNFGATAGLCEMLLQSHAGCIELLPALPGAWPSGLIRGLRARGGFGLDLEWRDGRLTRADIASDLGTLCVVRYGHRQVAFETTPGGRYVLDANLIV